VKEFWRWLLDGGHIEKDAFAKVKPIGKANAGSSSSGRSRRRRWSGLLFEKAKQGEEGALAILVQLYLGLRPSEVLGLTVGAVDGINVFVNGTKNQNAKRRLELYAPVAKILAKHCAKRPLSERIFASDRERSPRQTGCTSACIPTAMRRRLRESVRTPFAVCTRRWRSKLGATSNDVARSLGHSSFAITAKHYAKADSIEVGKARRMAGSMHAKTR
jgi:integrase